MNNVTVSVALFLVFGLEGVEERETSLLQHVMKVTKRSVDEDVVEIVVDEKRPKMVDHMADETSVGVVATDHRHVGEEEPMDAASNGHKSTPTRCPICLWPADSPQCYHSN